MSQIMHELLEWLSRFVPPVPDPCQAQKDALAAANQALEELDGDIADLQEKLRLLPPAKQAEIRKQISALRKQRKALVGQRDEASVGFEQCRAQHPAVAAFSQGGE